MPSLSEYFALKKAANPEDRNIKGISTMMATNANKPDPYGIQGLANLPLSYALGKANAAAGEYDQQTAAQGDAYMQQQLQQHKDDQLQKAKESAMKNWLELGKQDPAAANDYADKDPVLQQALPSGIRLKDKITKDGWITGETLSEDGRTKTVYQLNLGGMEAAKQKLQSMGVTGTPTVEELTNAMPPGFAFKLTGASKAAAEPKDPKLTGHVVRDKESPTGWSYAGEDGEVMATGAPDPYKGKEHTGGGGSGGPTAEQKGFSTWATKYDGLVKARAAIEKGFDPFTGQALPQTQLDTAKASIQEQIGKTERYMQSTFPNEWRTYAGAAPAPSQAPAGRQLDPATAKQILYDAGGDKNKARQMARGLGFTF